MRGARKKALRRIFIEKVPTTVDAVLRHNAWRRLKRNYVRGFLGCVVGPPAGCFPQVPRRARGKKS